ncbi:hypothetical protein [Microbulbifer sp. HZ11]|uniref:hypothetical protein n=1 Tax=Microbulbifer sp. HZ11 TaxID=1453501 RepID=UPI0005BCE450|nr:hypothetical protein [Microbulbifer sp. HZ11]
MKQVVSCLLALTLCISGNLVWGDSEFNRWKQKQRGAFEGFVTARDREFAKYLRTSWREFQAHKALVREQTPKPKCQPRVPQLEASQGAMEPAPTNSPFGPDSLEPLQAPQPKPAAPNKNPVTQPGTFSEQKSPQQENLIRVGLYGSALRFPPAPNLRNVRLMHVVQNGFKYQTNDEQFGGERYLLPSESIYYNAIDCEDRSLVRRGTPTMLAVN